MNATFRVRWLVVWMALGVSGVAATETDAPVEWHTELQAAWTRTRGEERPMLLFVTRDDCAFCVKMKQGTLDHPAVADLIQRAYVPLLLDGAAGCPLLDELKVHYYPATFIISPQAVILERIDGYVSPTELARRLTKLRPPAGVATNPAAR